MYQKKGYLDEPFRLFYVSDQEGKTFPYHYHDFDKIILFLQGQVQYDIEGNSYALKPYDIVLVQAGQLHRPIVADTALYERIIAYLSPNFFKNYIRQGCDLSTIFSQSHSHVLRQAQTAGNVYNTACRLKQAFTEKGLAASLLQNTIFLEFMIQLTRAIDEQHMGYVKTGQQNEKIQSVLDYINKNLTADLSVAAIAGYFYMSPDYLMHLFKNETGYPLGTYITTKRLLKARQLIQKKQPLTTVCYDSGFKNYSTFYRAWTNRFHQSPRKGLRGLSIEPEILD
jgi:AraC-like DNA-binding protein